jgi:phospholipase C
VPRGVLLLFIAIATACSPSPGSISASGAFPIGLPARAPSARPGKIAHLVIVVQENRSFDNFFATFPGADGTTSGRVHSGATYPLKKSGLIQIQDICHSYQCYRWDYDHKKMDGFDLSANLVGASGLAPYQYVDPAQIAPYWTIARRYVLGDRMFQTQGSSSFTAHQDLIAGDTAFAPDERAIDLPNGLPWGCDAPAGTHTAAIKRFGQYIPLGGPFPCYKYATLRDLLDAKGQSWKYYTPSSHPRQQGGRIWDAFDAIDAVRHGPEWATNVSWPNTNLFSDLSGGRLAAVSWVIPQGGDSDHPGYKSDTGPSWVAQVVNAIGKSKYWNSTAIVIVWDDWGGMYDHVPPPQLGYGGLGFRVPMLVVSPYAKRGYVSHTQYEFASILKFAEDNWHLGRLGHNDRRATSIADCFDFTQAPRKFAPISAKYRLEYFLKRPPFSGKEAIVDSY